MERTIHLNKKIVLRGEIITFTGLLIGGSNNSLSIGGPDKTVIRNPINNEPYIPGSSLKGKLRSLLELKNNIIKVEKIQQKNGSTTYKYSPDDDISNTSTLLFGAINRDSSLQRPSRLIVRDSNLINGDDFIGKTDLPFTESKIEVSIDRITAAANPRTFERVPVGARFGFEMILNILTGDMKTPSDLLKSLFEGLLLLEDDYLGGGGSRGNGKVKIFIKHIFERDARYYNGEIEGEGEDIISRVNVPLRLLKNEN